MPLNVGEKRKSKGVCPICGEPLSDLFGITRCSVSTCDYVDYTRADAQVEAAGRAILRGGAFPWRPRAAA